MVKSLPSFGILCKQFRISLVIENKTKIRTGDIYTKQKISSKIFQENILTYTHILTHLSNHHPYFTYSLVHISKYITMLILIILYAYSNRMVKFWLFLEKVTFLVIPAGGITPLPNLRFTSVPSPTVTFIWSTFRNSKKFWSFTKRFLKLSPETWFWLSTCPNAPFSTELPTNIWRNCWLKTVIPTQCLQHRKWVKFSWFFKKITKTNKKPNKKDWTCPNSRFSTELLTNICRNFWPNIVTLYNVYSE